MASNKDKFCHRKILQSSLRYVIREMNVMNRKALKKKAPSLMFLALFMLAHLRHVLWHREKHTVLVCFRSSSCSSRNGGKQSVFSKEKNRKAQTCNSEVCSDVLHNCSSSMTGWGLCERLSWTKRPEWEDFSFWEVCCQASEQNGESHHLHFEWMGL